MQMPSLPHRRTVFIVDDDASVRDSLSLLLSLRGFATAMFASAEDFLRVLSPHWRGCVLADIRMPGMSGLDMQQVLASHPARLPVIIITGHGDIDAARQALKASAVDFLEKPFEEARLVAAIDEAMRRIDESEPSRDAGVLGPSLSQRERQVMSLVVEGQDNRSIGEQLGISARTVEVHKARMMAKLGVRNLVELMRVAKTREAR
ncbi:MAG TPA: response regulator [Burkholderiaceae bacterium]|jgi:FixJ family two-component response regulator|nr:response regulator [Burkholderiaceae bacterium]